MLNKRFWLGMLVIALVFGMTVVGCDDGSTDTVEKAPEEKTVAERWWIWVDNTSSTAVTYSVDNNDVCAITIAGTPETTEYRWKTNVRYSYTGKKDTPYIYKFEAWTQNGERTVNAQYYDGGGSGPYLDKVININNTRTTYEIKGEPLPKDEVSSLQFQSSDLLGTFYIKIISITESEQRPQKLTITGIGSKYGHWMEPAVIMDTDWNIVAINRGSLVTDGTLTFYLWEYEDEENYWNNAGKYLICISIWGENIGGHYIYTGGKTFDYGDMNQYTYTFTKNGSYTINFNQFEDFSGVLLLF